MYKIETHLHTPLISPCAVLSPEELVLSYKEAGYAAVTVTDHYKASAFSCAGISWDAPGDKLITYRRILQNRWTLYAVAIYHLGREISIPLIATNKR